MEKSYFICAVNGRMLYKLINQTETTIDPQIDRYYIKQRRDKKGSLRNSQKRIFKLKSYTNINTNFYFIRTNNNLYIFTESCAKFICEYGIIVYVAASSNPPKPPLAFIWWNNSWCKTFTPNDDGRFTAAPTSATSAASTTNNTTTTIIDCNATFGSNGKTQGMYWCTRR